MASESGEIRCAVGSGSKQGITMPWQCSPERRAKQRKQLAAEDKNECRNRPNGLYPIANSFGYVACIDGSAKYKQCEKDKIFVPSCWQCLVQLPSQLGFFCEGRAAESAFGHVIKYQHPWDCRSWLECVDNTLKEHYCTDNSMFDPEHQRCTKHAKCSKLAPISAPYSFTPFTASELPRKINAAFLWSNGDIVIVDGSTYSMYDAEDASLLPGYPLKISNNEGSGIPRNVDAALSLPDEQKGQKVFFFKGNKVWLWGEVSHPKRISQVWPGVPNDLDAAFYWPHTNRVYFFKGKYFYRFNLETRSVDAGYPKEISRSWRGATPKINAGVSMKNGTILLFKGHKHYTFNPPFCRATGANN
eukprot:gene20121-22093_t